MAKILKTQDLENLSLLPRRTVWGNCIQTANYTRGRIKYVAGTTLNEKYGIAADMELPDGVIPAPEYFGVGRGSTYMKVLSDGSHDTVNYIHHPLDAALFYQTPFVLRTFDNDLSIAERQNYAIRIVVNVNGINYIAYYLKRLDRSNTEIVAQIIVPATEDEPRKVTPVEPDERYLNPVPRELDSNNIRTDGAYTDVTSVMKSSLNAWDIDEMINAKKIMTGNAQLEITELGLFSAVPMDYVSPPEVGTGVIQYKEAIKAQLNVTTPQRILINSYVGRTLTIDHDLGISDPSNFQLLD